MADSIARDLDLLEKSLTALNLDYERFFSGDVKVPPLPARKNVEQALRRIGSAPVEKVAERFRLQALESRFTSLADRWERRLLAREEGREKVRLTARARLVEPGAPPPAGDASAPGSVRDSRRGDLRSLFDRYRAARAAAGEDTSRLRYDRFEELVKKQAAEIRKATGATRLVFEVQTRDGKVRLIGRALAAPKKGLS